MREEFAPRPTATERDLGMLKDARDADLAAAVRREQADAKRQGFSMSAVEAKNQVLERIGTEGVAGILPHYAKIRTRLRISNDVELNDEQRPVKVRTASQFSQDTSPTDQTPDLDAMRHTIEQAIAAGEDASDSIALLRHYESQE